MKIVVDRARCNGLGICESLAPSIFELSDDGKVELKSDIVTEQLRDAVDEAIDGCPFHALHLQK